MTVDLLLAEEAFSFDAQETAEQVLAGFLKETGCPHEAAVSVSVVNGDEIRRLNREYRGLDRETDVLSFPAQDYPTPGGYESAGDSADAFLPESGELFLGDVILSRGHIAAQAEAYGHSEKREYAFLIAHSLLHLVGYDHEEEDERQIMEQLQDRILATCGISREVE